MKPAILKIILPLLCLLGSLCTAGTEVFPFKPVAGYGFKLSLGVSKGGKVVKVEKLYRDQEGDSYALIHSKGGFPIVGGRSSSNMPNLLPKDNLYTIVRISPAGKPLWFFHLNNRQGRQFSFQNFKVSPQGNIAIMIGFEGDLEVQGSLRKFRSIKRDILYLFMNKDKPLYSKTLHFTGRENEVAGDVTWGTGGEMLLHLKSSSNKVSYDHGFYIFNTKTLKPTLKDLIIRVKKNFFPKWKRSLEPSALESVTFHDKDKVFLGFSHTGEVQGLYQMGKSIKVYKKPKRTKSRAIGVSLDTNGAKKWEIQLRHNKGGGKITQTKAFPDGGVGVEAILSDNELSLYGQQSFNIPGTFSFKGLLLKLGPSGLLKESVEMTSEKGAASLYSSHSSASLLALDSGKDSDVSYKNLSQGATTLTPADNKNCPHFVITDELLKAQYEITKSNCQDKVSMEAAHLRLASGHIEILRMTPKSSQIELLKIKYGKERLDDETIQGLAYQPNFINESNSSGKSSEYNFSYAIPPKVQGVMVYFISHPRDHLDALRGPLIQASLNSAYFRNYVPVTVWSSQENIQGQKIEELFEKVLDEGVLKKDWPWYFQAFGKRAGQINSLYKGGNTNLIGKLDPKMLILWDLPDQLLYQEEGEEKEKRRQLIVKQSLTTLFVSPGENKAKQKKIEKLYNEFQDQRKKSAHIITNPQVVSKTTFAAIPGVGILSSQNIFEELKKKEDCLHAKGYFGKAPDSLAFKNSCFSSLKSIQDLPPATQAHLKSFMSKIYDPSDFIPYYDKEIYNFIEGRAKGPSRQISGQKQ